MIKRVVLVLAALGLAGGAAVAWLVRSGFYDVAATEPHTALVNHVMHYAMRRSVKARVAGIQPPPLDDRARLARGEVLYREHCLQCHGGPGVPPHPLGMGLRPLPTNLAQDGREWPAAEIYWVVKHGVRMTAMPGWQYRLSDDDLWAVTAFVKHLPHVAPHDFVAATPAGADAWAATSHAGATAARAADARAGKHLVAQYMCGTCHQIPGVAGADRNVGPPLGGVADRTFIGGVLRNTPENMVRWLLDPQRVAPSSAMPNLHMSEADAQDIAAFLATLRDRER